MKNPSTVILFTGSYPYEIAREDTFLNLEIIHLSKVFERIILIPEVVDGDCYALPTNVAVNHGYARMQRGRLRYLKTAVSAFTNELFWSEIMQHPRLATQKSGLVRLLLMAEKARRTTLWVRELIAKEDLDVRKTLFYTYWLDQAAVGIGQLKRIFPQIKLVSRAHGYDLYEYRYQPPYIPLRRRCLQHLDRLFLISEDGKLHIATQYPEYAELCVVSRLGVPDPGFTSLPSRDGAMRILSCSFLTVVKRPYLLFSALTHLARLTPKQRFIWTHIGNGPLLSNLKHLAQSCPDNLECQFLGYLPSHGVMNYYKNHPIDVFVNVSSSEGVSVAIMEALSCGVPVVATAVGGTPEIVSADNGVLLPANPEPEMVAESLWGILGDGKSSDQKRLISRDTWAEKYNADINFAVFATSLSNLVESA